MKRRLLQFLFLAAILVALATAVLWPCSYAHGRAAAYVCGHVVAVVFSTEGQAAVLFQWGDSISASGFVSYPMERGDGYWLAEYMPYHIRMGAFVFAGGEVIWPAEHQVMVAWPHWFRILLAACVVFLTRRAFRKPRPQDPAAVPCGKCGYDLRAHQAGGRCPECGEVVSNHDDTPFDKLRARTARQEKEGGKRA